MDQILLRRRDKHTSRLSAERIPSPSPMPVLKACNKMCSHVPAQGKAQPGGLPSRERGGKGQIVLLLN